MDKDQLIEEVDIEGQQNDQTNKTFPISFSLVNEEEKESVVEEEIIIGTIIKPTKKAKRTLR